MKVERGDDFIKFIPQSDFEEECLKLLSRKSIEKKTFEDDWNQSGPLVIKFMADWAER